MHYLRISKRDYEEMKMSKSDFRELKKSLKKK